MRRISITPHVSQTEADVKGEIDRSNEAIDYLLQRGMQEWEARYRWIGPVKVMVSKEVGPPPWRFPQVHVSVRVPHANFTVGWRSTAYTLNLMWARRVEVGS